MIDQWKKMKDAPLDGTILLVTVGDEVTEAFFCVETGLWPHEYAFNDEGEACNVGLPIAWMHKPDPFVATKETP
jgi:hypothetical protein